MKGKYVLTHDLGTSGNKAALFDSQLNCIGHTKEEYPIFYPKPGWAEQNAEDFWKAVVNSTHKLFQDGDIKPEDISALTFTCQMNCTIPINKDGKPLMNCISWLDTRASKIITAVMDGWPKIKGFYSIRKVLKFIKLSGGAPGPHGKDPISHYLWLKENEPELYDETFKFLNVKDYIIHKCTKAAVTSKDLANTSWLMNSNPDAQKWSDELIEKFQIDREKLPDIKETTDVAGGLLEAPAKELGLVPGIPVFVGSGDLTSVALGSGGIMDRQFIMCLGTADWVAAHVNVRKVDLKNYIGSICSAQNNYLYIAKQETGAVCLDWIKDRIFLDLVEKYKDNEPELYKELDRIVENTEPGAKKLIFLPWLFGERCPLPISHIRGGFLNMGLEHEREDLLRAVYEGVAYNIKWALILAEKFIGKAADINFIGGGAKSDIWCQIIADVTNRTIKQMELETIGGTRGAAIIALVGLGILNSFYDAIPLIKVKNEFFPDSRNRSIYDMLFKEYIQVFERNKKMFRNLNL